MPTSRPPSHRPFATAAAITSTASIAALVMSRATRDALFLSSFEVARLPGVMILGATASLFTALWTGRLVARLSPARVMPVAFAASSFLFVVHFALLGVAPRVVAIALYLHLAIFGGTLVSMLWSTLNERFDPRTAKRYVGWIAGGGTAGGILGGMAALGAAHSVSIRGSLVALAGLHLFCAIVSLRLRGESQAGGAAKGEPAEALPSALRVLGEVSYLRQLAVLVVTVSTMEALADYVLNARAAATLSSRADLMAFFALFHTAIAFATFALQMLVSRVAVERLGLAGAVSVLPLFVIPGAAVAALVPTLWSAGVLRGTMAGIGNSLYRSGYELLFNPLPLEKKRPTKTVIDVAFDRLGTAAGSTLALAIVALPGAFAGPLLLATVFVLAVLSLFTVRRLNAGYIRTLEDSLKTGTSPGDPGAHELGLSQTHARLDTKALAREIESFRRENLLMSSDTPSPFAWYRAAAQGGGRGAPDPLLAHAAMLTSGDAGAIRAELALPDIDPRLAACIIPLLANEDVAQEGVRALSTVADRITGQLTDALLDPGAPFVVRRRVARVMSRCTTQRAVDGLLLGLGDDRFEVRYQCGLALLRMTRDQPRLVVAREMVLSAVKREVHLERKLWQQRPPLEMTEDEAEVGLVDAFLRDRTSRSLEHVFAALSLVFEREPMRLALRALSGDDEIQRGTALEYLEQVLPADVRSSLWPFLAAPEQRASHGVSHISDRVRKR